MSRREGERIATELAGDVAGADGGGAELVLLVHRHEYELRGNELE